MAINDEEFGEITVRRNKLARVAKISVAPNGKLRASLPFYAPDFSIKRLIRQNRAEIRDMLKAHSAQNVYESGQQIGKSHSLIFRKTNQKNVKISAQAQEIIVEIPADLDPSSTDVQALIREYVDKILRKQAKSYLPRRLGYLADKYSFSYNKVKFTHASTRWGSCGSSGTISLNIALMNLPHELIDYVLVHELCHTREMNHSDKFWAEVAAILPNYKQLVKELKKYNPSI